MTDIDPIVADAAVSQVTASRSNVSPQVATIMASISSDLDQLQKQLDDAIARRQQTNEEIRDLRDQINFSVRVLRSLTPKPPRQRMSAKK